MNMNLNISDHPNDTDYEAFRKWVYPVPKIIHYIWLGPKDPYLPYLENWKKVNPDFEFKFWNSENIPKEWENKWYNSCVEQEKW